MCIRDRVRLLGTNGGTNPLLIVKNKASGSNETSYAPSGFVIRPGLTFIDEGPTNPTSMVAYATTSYNTGWMQGDIKGAFLSDTDATNASVSTRNLITNSTFADTSNWTGATNGVLTAPTGSGSYASGTVLRITNTGGANGRAISNTFSTTVGKQYGIRVSFTNRSSNGQYRIEVRQSGNDLTPEPGTTTAGYYNYQFISAGTGTYLSLIHI